MKRYAGIFIPAHGDMVEGIGKLYAEGAGHEGGYNSGGRN